MKELKAQNLLGNRLEQKVKNVTLYLPFKQKLLNFGAKYQPIKIDLVLFEKGIKISSSEVGSYIVLFESLLKS